MNLPPQTLLLLKQIVSMCLIQSVSLPFGFILTFIEGNLNQEVDIEKPKKKQRNDYLATDVKIK